jgi:histone H1/5
MNAGNIYQLNRAITHGAESNVFVLPKGPSGKIKLAPKAKAGAAKEVSLTRLLVSCFMLTMSAEY